MRVRNSSKAWLWHWWMSLVGIQLAEGLVLSLHKSFSHIFGTLVGICGNLGWAGTVSHSTANSGQLEFLHRSSELWESITVSRWNLHYLSWPTFGSHITSFCSNLLVKWDTSQVKVRGHTSHYLMGELSKILQYVLKLPQIH